MTMPTNTQTRFDVFGAFAAEIQAQTPLRAAITRHDRAPEPACVAALVDITTLPLGAVGQACITAIALVEARAPKVRAERSRA